MAVLMGLSDRFHRILALSPVLRLTGCALFAATALTVVLVRPVLLAYQQAPAKITKQRALSGIAQNVLLPGYVSLSASAGVLSKASREFAAAPSAATLEKTQRAWTETLLAWRRTQAFVHGPVADLEAYPRLQFWPSRPQSITKIL